MIHNYSSFISLNENISNDFKNSKYFKVLFDNSDEFIKSEIINMLKKIDIKEKDKIIKIFENYLSENQNYINKKVDEYDIDSIDKLLSDNIKNIYFSLYYTQQKIDNKEFSNIFEKADKDLKKLMELGINDFSNYVSNNYIDKYITPKINKITTKEINNEDQNKENQNEENNIKNKNLEYIKNFKSFFNSIFDMIWKKLKNIKTEVRNNRKLNLSIEQLSGLMKNSNNNEAKIKLLRKISSISKEDLKNIAISVGLNTEEMEF